MGLDGEAYKRAGHSLTSWTTGKDGSGTKYGAYGSVTGSAGQTITLYAQWSLDRYDISYSLAGGTWEGGTTAPSSYDYAASGTVSIPNPVRVGYEFLGWTGTGLSSATKDLVIDRSSNDKLGTHTAGTNVYTRSYTATWKPYTYSIDFYDGTTKVSTQTGFTYATAKALAPTGFTETLNKGYHVDGWSYADGGAKALEAAGSISTPSPAPTEHGDTVNLYAKWAGNAYSVRFHDDDALAYTQTGFVYGAPKVLDANGIVSRAGYALSGWSYTKDGKKAFEPTASIALLEAAYIPTAASGGHLDLYPCFTEKTDYTVEFNIGVTGATSVNKTYVNQPYESGAFRAPDATEAAVRGYTLLGWSKTDPGTTVYEMLPTGAFAPGTDLTVKDVYGSAVPPATCELYAVYRLDAYTIDLDHAGGAFPTDALAALKGSLGQSGSVDEAGATIVYSVRTSTFSIPSSARSGYAFSRWAEGAAAALTVIAPSDAAFELKDYDFVAEWSANAYALELSYENASGAVVDCAFADPADAPVSYAFDKDLGDDYSVTLNDPYRRGYAFTGWSGPGLVGEANKGGVVIRPNTQIAAADTNAGVLLYTAHWVQVDYRIDYDMADGNYEGHFEEGASDPRLDHATYTFDETYVDTGDPADKPSVAIASPKRAGYAFSGWRVTSAADGSAVCDTTHSIDLPLAEDLLSLFEDRVTGSGSTQRLVGRMGFLFDAAECPYVTSNAKALSFLRDGGFDGSLAIEGSEAHADAGSRTLKVLPVTGAFSLAQADDGAMTFSELTVDLSEIRIKTESDLRAEGIADALHLADIVWSVELT